jgi:hypothetical protein
MNESQFERFIADAANAVQAKNDALEARYGLSHFARWDHDGVLNQLTFSSPDDPNIVVATTTDIGSYSHKTNTWLWAWANESHTDASRERSAVLKQLHGVTGLRLFTDPHHHCDETLAWELAAVSVQYMNGAGVYRGPTDHLWCFWSLDAVKEVRRGE